MIHFRSIYNLVIYAAIFFLIALFFEAYFFSSEKEINTFQQKLLNKEKFAKKELQILLDHLTDSSKVVDFENLKQYSKKGVIFLCYTNDSLIFWSDNHIRLDTEYDTRFDKKNFIQYSNGDYVVVKKETTHYKLVALIRITSKYVYQNRFLKNGFHDSFSSVYEMQLEEKGKGAPIYNNYNTYLFSISTSKIQPGSTTISLLSVLYLLSFLFLCFFVFGYLRRERKFHYRRINIAIFGAFLLLLRLLMLKFKIPSSVYSLELFNPMQHASSFFFPSLGDFVLNALFFFMFAYAFSNYYRLSKYTNVKVWFYIVLSISIFIFGILFFKIIDLVRNLILDSSFSLQIHSISNLNKYSFWGFLAITLFFYGFLLGVDVFTRWSHKHIKISRFYLVSFVSILLAGIIFFVKGEGLINILFLISLLFLYGLFTYTKLINLKYTISILLFIITSAYLVFFIGKYSEIKERETRKTAAINLSTEYDPLSMALLLNINQKLNNDDYLRQFLMDPFKNEELIKDHLYTGYFTNYWDQFDIDVLICSETDKIEVDIDDAINCYTYFSDLLENEKGQKIPNTDFYVLNIFDGRVSYLGILRHYSDIYGPINIYIEIISRFQDEGLGYPDLLLDSKYRLNKSFEKYSYAKYKNDNFIVSSGEFDYYWNISKFRNPNPSENYFIDKDHYSHYVYHVNDKEYVVVSTPIQKISDRWITFPYIFVMLYIFAILIWLLERFPWKYPKHISFRDKILIAFISVLMVFFLLLVGGSLYYTYKQFQKRNLEELSEKLKLLKYDIFDNLNSTEDVDEFYDADIPFLLRNYSNIIKTDINIYNPSGDLIATSRPEIFERGLMGEKIDAYVFNQLRRQRKAQVINKERIGELRYSSAYIALYNRSNKTLGYLNLPYFLRYEELRLELLSLIMAAVNLHLFIILIAIFLSIIISNRITSPLKLIQDKFKKVMLGRKNEPIVYDKKDEIKGLVNAYNRMVAELEESAGLLAQSERESAWREMAKQVAHEIKNPLTPMRLSIQFLQKAWSEKAPDLDVHVDKTSKILLEQINQLSQIAVAFSNFAKMPRGNNKKENLVKIIQETIDLYQNTDLNIRFIADHETLSVYVDAKQFRRVYVNLIKNAQQSIAEHTNGLVTIYAGIKNGKALTYVKDNGSGIEEQNKVRIFVPNFTTKSGGMGLGLAIVKNIVNDAKGRIWFETEKNKGSTFFVEIPLFS